MQEEQTSCSRCGACCKEGGPALHGADIDLIRSKALPFDALITIRKGELVINPEAGGLVPSRVELIKIKGKKGSWTCTYYDEGAKGCSRYNSRPLACSTLKCWDTTDILAIMEKDTLCRADVLDPNSNAFKLVVEYEELCPCPDFAELVEQKGNFSESLQERLAESIKTDLLYRDKMAKEHNLGLADELFLFGRPLFQLLQPFGAKVFDSPMGIEVAWSSKA